MSRWLVVAACLVPLIFTGLPLEAQGRPRPALEGLAGWAGFADDARVDHGVVGGAARVYLTPRLGIGPELVYMIGPGTDRDVMLTGNLTFDMLRPRATGRWPVNPYLVAGGGVFQHRDRFGSRSFSSTEGSFTAGGGARIFVTDRVYFAPDARIGWELHLRIVMTAGVRLGD